nr:hypothetical protein [Actinoplanes ferrugineus]
MDLAGGLAVGGEELGYCLIDDVVSAGVEVDQCLADGFLEVVGAEAVDTASLFRSVPVAGPAGVVAVAVAAAVGGGADVLSAALRTGDLPGEGVVGRVCCSLSDLLAAPVEDGLGFAELILGDDGGVGVDDGDVAEALLADVEAVGDDHFYRCRRPDSAAFGAQAAVVERVGDGAGAEPVLGVEVEDEPDYRCFCLHDDDVVGLGVLDVADRHGAAVPQALRGLAFHARDDAVDDHFALEFSEHPEHLHEHASDRGGGVERLGGRPEGHTGVGEVVE